ncbi:MAG: RagB/SusD family nutrient uptake outer membrane protein [Gemmatimonas sp.]|nr:RagB/SusD family nutrient uptake outer membrane protein [Gemmatimonas sp.]
MTHSISQRLLRLMVGAGLLVGSAGCGDFLEIENLNDPDRERALAQPQDLEALLGGTWAVYFGIVHGSGPTFRHPYVPNLFPNVATQFTSTTSTGGTRENVEEPRRPIDNNISVGSNTGTWGPRILYDDMNQIAASVRQGLVTLEEVQLVDENGGDGNPRARAFAKFMQGLAWSTSALIHDKVSIVDENAEVSSDPVQQAIESFVPWEEGLARGLAALEEAIGIAEQNSFSFPAATVSHLWFAGQDEITSDELARIARTYTARFLVLSARNQDQREQSDWNRVLELTGNGVTRDFEIVLEPEFRESIYYARSELNTAGCGNCYRWDNRLIGHADISGNYQAWISATRDERFRFDITTPDRRITGPTPHSDGAYTRYRADDNGFQAGAGLYLFSAYQWARHAHRGFEANTGTAILVSVDENNLLRAEALLRTGDTEGAAELINITRTRAHVLPDGSSHPGLPAVTADGVPISADCVPRTDSGQCGDLMVALWYERMIELAGLDAIRGYGDSRGFGLLPEGAWTQAPLPPEELELLGVSNYTFGGEDDPFGAVYAPAGSGR